MEKMFNKLSDALFSQLSIDETLTISFFGENSQFIRVNNSKIRQTGLVDDAGLELNLFKIRGFVLADLLCLEILKLI